MREIALTGKFRTESGKKATRELRKEGLVPCNLYGEARGENGLPVAKSFAVSARDLRKVVFTPHVYIVNLEIDGEAHTAVIKELQFHPVTDAVLHVDFLEVVENKPLTIGIPVNLVGLAQGVRDGGKMNLSIRKVKVTAPYKNIPEKLDVDVTKLNIGKSIKVGDLNFEGLEIATPKEVIVCTIKRTRAAMSAASQTEAEEA